jgi:hypothetical protein
MPFSGMWRHVALVLTTQRHIPENKILHSRRHENLKSYKKISVYALYIILLTKYALKL